MFDYSVKKKFIANFFFLLLIISAFLYFETYYLNQTKKDFVSYRESARLSVALKSLESDLLLMIVDSKEFMNNFEDKDNKDVYSDYESARASLLRAKELSSSMPSLQDEIAGLQKLIDSYKESFDNVVLMINERNVVVNQILDVYGADMVDNLRKAMEATDCADTSLEIAKVLHEVFMLRLHTSKFLLNNKQHDLQIASKQSKILENTFLNQPKKSECIYMVRSKELLRLYIDGFKRVSLLIQKRNKIIEEELEILELSLKGELKELSASVIAMQDSLGPKIVKQNENFLDRTLIFSVILLLLFVVVSVLFINDFSKKITIFQAGLARFFSFLHDNSKRPTPIAIDSKDEIGQMSDEVNRNIEQISNIIKQRDRANRLNFEILNAQTSFVLLTDGVKMKKANRSLLEFLGYSNEEEFGLEHECVCDFFQNETGYVQKYMDEDIWVDYVAKHHERLHRVKMKDRIFDLVARRFYFEDIFQYIVVFSDITKEVMVQEKLESSVEEIGELNEQLKGLTISDPLTSLYNRRGLEEYFEKMYELLKRKNSCFSLLVLDIDHFKMVNDKYGHDVGDKVLVGFSNELLRVCRDSDLVGRFGGEEFVVIMPNANKNEAIFAAERIKEAIMIYPFEEVPRITVSCGVVTVSKLDRDFKSTYQDALITADKALYRAKDSGRNMVVHSDNL
jgi:diguanylate cyclase (GGDEF)-like protein